ncbi:hypothetical protein V6N12_008463 [Hibiscus sabdariffa]|uniref:Uncharacterized protein n=1 Tax=Hibiscus sabdariffa TaxID=183260 RepID=A0ABR2BJ91_9ROSI
MERFLRCSDEFLTSPHLFPWKVTAATRAASASNVQRWRCRGTRASSSGSGGITGYSCSPSGSGGITGCSCSPSDNGGITGGTGSGGITGGSCSPSGSGGIIGCSCSPPAVWWDNWRHRQWWDNWLLLLPLRQWWDNWRPLHRRRQWQWSLHLHEDENVTVGALVEYSLLPIDHRRLLHAVSIRAVANEAHRHRENEKKAAQGKTKIDMDDIHLPFIMP